MKRRIGSRFALAASLGLAALLASACSAASSSSDATGKLTTVTVGVLPISDDAPFFIALKKGYFKQEGLDVKAQIIQQSTLAIPDMQNGTVDVAAGGNYVSWMAAVANSGLPLRIIAPSDQCAKGNLVVLALPSSGIKTPQNLVGKTIAVNLPANIQTLTINAVLKADNVDASKYTPVKIPFPNMPTTLAAKQVDAVASVEPFITALEEKGAVPVLDECQGPTANISVSGYWALDSWVKKNGSAALAFQKAILKAQTAADANRKLVEQVLPTYTKITPKVASLMSLPYYPTSFDTAQLQRVADLMQTWGYIHKPLNVSTIVFH